MDPIGNKKAIVKKLEVGKKIEILHKLPNEQREQTSKRGDQVNFDTGPINQGKRSGHHRHHPYNPHQQSRQQHQQVQHHHQHPDQHQQQKQQPLIQQKSEAIDITCNFDQFGSNGNSVQELPADQNITCDLTESSPKQSQEPDILQVKNHDNPARVKFEEDQNNSYSPKHSFNDRFDSLDIGQRKRKQEQNQSKIPVNEAIDEEVERERYDEEEKEAKRTKLDAVNEQRFDYFESDFPASFGINVQTNVSQIEPMFSFTRPEPEFNIDLQSDPVNGNLDSLSSRINATSSVIHVSFLASLKNIKPSQCSAKRRWTESSSYKAGTAWDLPTIITAT